MRRRAFVLENSHHEMHLYLNYRSCDLVTLACGRFSSFSVFLHPCCCIHIYFCRDCMARMLAHTTPRPTIRLIRQCEFRARCIATMSDMAHIMELVCLRISFFLSLLQIRFSYYVYYIGKYLHAYAAKKYLKATFYFKLMCRHYLFKYVCSKIQIIPT